VIAILKFGFGVVMAAAALLSSACSTTVGSASNQNRLSVVRESLPRPQRPDCNIILSGYGRQPYDEARGVFVLMQRCARRDISSTAFETRVTTFAPETGRIRDYGNPCRDVGTHIPGLSVAPDRVYNLVGGSVAVVCQSSLINKDGRSIYRIRPALVDLDTGDIRVLAVDIPALNDQRRPFVAAISTAGELLLWHVQIRDQRQSQADVIIDLKEPAPFPVLIDWESDLFLRVCHALVDQTAQACRIAAEAYLGDGLVVAEVTAGGADLTPRPGRPSVSQTRRFLRSNGETATLRARRFQALIAGYGRENNVVWSRERDRTASRNIHDTRDGQFIEETTAESVDVLQRAPREIVSVTFRVDRLLGDNRIANLAFGRDGDVLLMQSVGGQVLAFDLYGASGLLTEADIFWEGRVSRNRRGSSLIADPIGRMYYIEARRIRYLGTIRET